MKEYKYLCVGMWDLKGKVILLGKCDSRNIFQNLNCVCVNRSRYLQIGTNL